MKPILFNTEMVQAILEGRKTITRRLIKPQPAGDDSALEPYKIGDVLYVRETWAFIPCIDCGLYRHGACRDAPTTYEDKEAISEGCFIYKADYPEPERICWHPSIHMPKQAARVFLRVTAIWVEKLKDINLDPPGPENEVIKEGSRYLCDFIALWEKTLKASDRRIYGWDANPYVWRIGFERVSKEVAEE